MSTLSFDKFRQQALQQGFDEVLERHWAADIVLQTHTHPFAVDALVTAGEMWLTTSTGTQHLTQGSRFQLPKDLPHSERYGPVGASYWVARKN